MSRIAQPAEKIIAVNIIYAALLGELEDAVDRNDTRVQVILLDIAARIAMATDTRDMGILG